MIRTYVAFLLHFDLTQNEVLRLRAITSRSPAAEFEWANGRAGSMLLVLVVSRSRTTTCAGGSLLPYSRQFLRSRPSRRCSSVPQLRAQQMHRLVLLRKPVRRHDRRRPACVLLEGLHRLLRRVCRNCVQR
jgi:hypothetical protein